MAVLTLFLVHTLHVTVDFSGHWLTSSSYNVPPNDRMHPRANFIVWKAEELVLAQLRLDLLHAYEFSADRLIRPLGDKKGLSASQQALR